MATALLLPILVALGEWQMQRGAQKAALLAQWATQAALPPLRIGPEEVHLLREARASGRRVLLGGRWDTRRQVLLDNQIFGGQAGYRVFTPLRLTGRSAVLVNRGWLTAGARRDVAPDVHPVAGEATVTGMVAPPPAPGFLARQAVDVALGEGLLRVQQLDIAELSQRLALDLEPWTLQLAPAAPQLAPERHRAYALQWFLFAALLVGLYVGLNLRR
ncbi:MAG: SURF1 family protein [Rhodocyclales bacterium]|nr:SURF1 family protein [Rhodocyclales bacterium]